MSELLPVILGSSSPRRSSILKELGLFHEVIPSPYDEESFIWSSDYHQSIQSLAKKKAEPLAERFHDRLLLTADTTVVYEGEVLNKPKDKAQARDYLTKLAGHEHQVLTAICVHYQGSFQVRLASTRVVMHPLSEEQIEQYIQTSIPYDKAGGYTIQGMGGLMVERIEGCYYNVLGLPVALVAQLLKPIGYDLWSIASSSHR